MLLFVIGLCIISCFSVDSFFVSHLSMLDAPVMWQLGFQDPATPLAGGILCFHNDLMFILIFVVCFVAFILYRAIYYFYVGAYQPPFSSNWVVHGTFIEVVWTLVPAIVLVFIAIPSFALLYSVDEVIDPVLTMNVVGHQWYWSYEYSDYISDLDSIGFDSYALAEEDLDLGSLRLLAVDNYLVLPVRTHVRLVVTSADVLHSWAVPAFGIKMDGCPGRLNQVTLYVQRCGLFFGQCSELCGVNHGFMPIGVNVVSLLDYLEWVYSNLGD